MAVSSDAYWLALTRVRGVGARVARLMLEKFGDAPQIFAQREEDLVAAGVYRPTAKNLVQFAQFETLEKELCEAARLRGSLVRWTDHSYPLPLRQIADPPPCFYVRGAWPEKQADCVTIVGARAASEAGLRMAQRLGMELALLGIVVVSGLARGIDSAAHRGALEGNGRTIAVMACGIDIIYPPEHRNLVDTMLAQGGAIISELPLGAPPAAENFPVRNRLISGLSLGVVVVEAAEKSGSLITARMALEQDRQVFAVPGSPLTGKTRGSNRLIKDGAKLVECVEDVIEELAPQLAKAPEPALEPPKPAAPPPAQAKSDGREDQFRNVVSHLSSSERVHVDSIVESSGLNVQTVLSVLLELELSGVVKQYPGKLFSLAQI